MNTKLWCTLSALLLNICSFAQMELPNGSFENWTGNVPDHWATSNLAGGNTKNVTPVSPGYLGERAVKGEVIVYPNTPGFPLIPLLESKTSEGRFAIDKLFPALNLYYKFHPAGLGDVLKIFFSIQGEGGTHLGSGFTEISAASADFKLLSIPVIYYIELQPVQVFVSITIDHNGTNDLPTLGSYFIVDGISLGPIVPPVLQASRDYPNPTDKEMYLPFLKNQHLKPGLVDLSSRKVYQEYSGTADPNEQQLPVDTSYLPNAVYLCRLATFGGSMSRKIQMGRN